MRRHLVHDETSPARGSLDLAPQRSQFRRSFDPGRHRSGAYHNDGTHAVMMTTPQDLEDLAVGFSLSEEIISSTVKLVSLEVLRLCDGIERRMWLSGPKADRLKGA